MSRKLRYVTRAGNVEVKLAELQTPKALLLMGEGGGGVTPADRGMRDANLELRFIRGARNEDEASPWQEINGLLGGSGSLICQRSLMRRPEHPTPTLPHQGGGPPSESAGLSR